jgi:hypothetical protein
MGVLVMERRAGNRLYKLFDTGNSSHKFGPCEVCGKPADAVYHLSGLEDGAYVLSQWGHRECLEASMGAGGV